MGVVSQALEKRRTQVAERSMADAVRAVASAQDPLGLTAAAASIPLDGTGWQTFKLGDQKWQKDGWHHYDINGDLRFLANWVGKACSRARLYLAKVDENGRPGEEVDDPKLQIIAETMFGSPAAKAEAQRLMGIHLFVPGESFIVAEAADNSNEDRWYVVSTSDIRRQGQTSVEVRRPQQYGGGWYTLKPGVDLLIRCWTPHPRAYDQADSSVRAGLIPLREIEQLTKFEFAEIDSRLAGAGILLVPDEMEFPREPGKKADAASLAALITKTMAASLSNREDPSSLVPIVIQVPGDLVDKVKHLTFANLLSGELKDRMEGAVNRLARSLETEPEILTGKADMNHWSSWQVDESTISIHVSPLLSRMCDALTSGYVRAALQILGEDPDAYVLWYDTAMLTVEPDRQKDGIEMWDKGLISDAAARKAGSWGEGDEPDDEEFLRRYAIEVVKLDPSKIEWPAIRKAIGRGVEAWEPPAAPPEGADQPNSAAGPTTADTPGGGSPNPDNVRGLPTAAGRQQAPDRRETRQAAALRVGAHMAVQRALELAGKRLLTREYRDRFQDVPAHELHTRIRVGDRNRVDSLLASANGPVVDLSMVAEAADLDETDLAGLLSAYCTELMVRGVRHNADNLGAYLAAGLHAGCTDDWCGAPDHPGRCGEDVRAFHLPGRHDQRTHGHRRSGGTGKPFTRGQRAVRKAERAAGGDPDADASGPDRQGRRRMAELEVFAAGLNAEQVDKEAEAKRRDLEEFRRIEAEAEAKKERERERSRKTQAEIDKDAELKEQWREAENEMQRQAADGWYAKENDRYQKNAAKGIYDIDFKAEAKRREKWDAATAKKIAEAKERFFAAAGNPSAITPRRDGGFSDQLRTDTGFSAEAAVPIDGWKLSDGREVHGFAFRQDGVTYMVEIDPESMAGKDDVLGREVALNLGRNLHTLAETLPTGWQKYAKGIFWSRQESPGNAYWQKRFKDPNHRAAASAGSKEITFWERNGGPGNWRKTQPQIDGETDDTDTIRHEHGHLVDHGSWKDVSTSQEWQGAADRDEKSARKLKINSFRQTTKGHRLTVDAPETGREQPNGVTTYGRSSPGEDFAESYNLYTAGVIGEARVPGGSGRGINKEPVYFRDFFPARAAELDKLFPDFGKKQKAAIRATRKAAE